MSDLQSAALASKTAAATAALELIEDDMLVGLGSGTTAEIFLSLLGKRVRSGLQIVGVPTSSRIGVLATDLGIALAGSWATIDIDIDGADEIDPQLNVLKGGGGALLREKIVASAANKLVIIADESKLVSQLTDSRPIPVEVIDFGVNRLKLWLSSLGANACVREIDGQPFRTDGGNVILDVVPPSGQLGDFPSRLKAQTGVIDHGIFTGMVDLVLIGCGDGRVKQMVSNRSRDDPNRRNAQTATA